MAEQIEIPCADADAAWRAVERVHALDPWCVEVDEANVVHALFGKVPDALAGRRVPANAARFGSGWRAAQRATQIGPLWILPPERKPPAGAKHVLAIDAMIAFGAGTHETTMMCLERIVELSPIDEVLDVGTGSGVLAIAALKLGARRARGVDVETKLLDEAQKNARRNGVELEIGGIEGRWPVVIANVRTPALIEMAPRLIAAATEHLVLSGIRAEEREEITKHFPSVALAHVAARGDWLRLDYRVR